MNLCKKFFEEIMSDTEKPKKGYYINAEEQRRMHSLIKEYLEITEDGQKTNYKAQRIMDELYTKYIDRIILGIIYNKKYQRFAELDDLMNEGRIAIYNSIVKKQWKEFIPKKNEEGDIILNDNGEATLVRGASLFSFFTTVAQKNILSYTLDLNKHRDHVAHQEVETLFDNDNMKFNEKHDERILIPEVFKELKAYFKDRNKLYQLACLLETYFHQRGGTKFVKKDFIEFAKAHTYSPSLINSFFTYLKNIKSIKYIIEN